MGKENKTLKTLQSLKSFLPELSEDTKKLPKYPNWSYVSNLKKVLLEESPDLDRRYNLWKKWDLTVASWTEENDLSTSKSFSKLLQNSKSQILSTLDVTTSSKEYRPTYATKNLISLSEKISEALLKDYDFQEFYNGVDLSKTKMEEKTYMWIISDVNKESIKALIGRSFEHPVEYVIPYDRLPVSMKNQKFTRGDRIFVDVKKDATQANLVSKKVFDQPRLDELKNMWIEVNWSKPIFYMTKWGKSFKWKIIWLGDDVTGKQVIFQTRDGKKKFPISIEGLKLWISLAKQKFYQENSVTPIKKIVKNSDYSIQHTSSKKLEVA